MREFFDLSIRSIIKFYHIVFFSISIWLYDYIYHEIKYSIQLINISFNITRDKNKNNSYKRDNLETLIIENKIKNYSLWLN